MTVKSVLIFTDEWGIEMTLAALPTNVPCGVVAASIRPHTHSPVQAHTGDLPFLIQPRHDSPDYPDFIRQVTSLAPDLILVNSYSMILRSDVLSVPPFGAINVHGALLPEYRGANPIQWALINGEREAGCTMHYMDEGIDTGDIIAQRRVPVLLTDTWLEVRHLIECATERLLADELPQVLAGTNGREPQDESRAKTWPRRKPEDGLIDWTRPVMDIYNLIRALVRPHPGAFYVDSDGEKIVIDTFRTLQEVSAMKYDPLIGGQRLAGRFVSLEPEG